MKKGKMSKVETYYMNNNPTLSNEEIAKDLDRPVALIEKNREKGEKSDKSERSEKIISPNPAARNNAYMNMVRPLDEQGNSRGIVIATEASTQVTDEFRVNNSNKSGRYSGSVAKVFKD